MKYTTKQIEEISQGDPIEIASFITNHLLYIEKLEIKIEQLETYIVKLETRVKELERQVGLTSTNSSKPPSSKTSKDASKVIGTHVTAYGKPTDYQVMLGHALVNWANATKCK